MLKRVSLLAVIATVLAVTLTAGSALGKRVAQPVSGTVVLSGWTSSPEEAASLEHVIAVFEAAHPAITVDYEPLDNYQPEMESRFAAGNPPDVFYVDSSYAPDWIAKGFLLPLKGLVTSSGFDTSHFFPVLRRAFEGSGGQPYGFPKDWSPLAMFTNNVLFGEAGVATPTTWAQLRSAAERLRAVTGVTPICLSAGWDRLLAFVEQNGGSMLNDSRTAVTINSTAASGAVEFYVGLVRDGLAALPDQLGSSWCGQAFADGKVAIAFEGSWLLPVLDSAVPRLDYSVHPLLSNVRPGSLAFTVAYSIAAASQHKQAAWELLSYLTGREGMQLWTSGGVALPSRDDVVPAPKREIFIGEAAVSTVWQFAPGFADVLNFANAELSSVFAGKETIGGMLTAIETAGNTVLGRSVTIAVSRPTVVYDKSVTLSGKVSDSRVGEKVDLLYELFGATSFSTLTTVDTTDGGRWTDVVKPTIETSYQARWKGATSSTVTVKVRPLITLVTLSKGTFSTKVRAARSFAGKFVLVQRLRSTGVTTLKEVRLDTSSSATFRVRLHDGSSRLRVVMPSSQTAPGYITGMSNVLTFRHQ